MRRMISSLALLAVCDVATAGTIIVPDHFPSVQGAVDVAVGGDVIQVELDGDGVVGISDIGVLLSLWGDC
ncbi:MAG: hypothetical protein GY715_10065 [Planctomycetes bacterium]|nr:hypothetical protein [Planctomycetota bacterium]